ncbi:hypothetical protein AVEN_137843-1 [Araneus ventricosus]|uniref:Uncharacterized protein n=1 Tax=Araneus ventricosus TaxID=182803 RepID=A0A4Y2QTI0_ARAVE|nr:hypothetical protein AVEN_137843-1 [Araneus ventricosus]
MAQKLGLTFLRNTRGNRSAGVLLVFAVAQWTDAKDLIDAMGYGVIYRDGSPVATSKDGLLWRSACGCGNTCGSYSSCRPNYVPAPPPPPPCRRRGGSGSFGGSGCGPVEVNPGIPDGPSIIRIVPDESGSSFSSPNIHPIEVDPEIPDGPSIIRIVRGQSGSSSGRIVRTMPSYPGIPDGPSIIRIVQSPGQSGSSSSGRILRPMPSNPGIPDGPSIIRIVESPDEESDSSGGSSGGGCSACGRKKRSLRK